MSSGRVPPSPHQGQRPADGTAGTVLVHLSDLHLDGSEVAGVRAAAVVAHIATMANVAGVLVSGDVSNRGDPEDYRVARALFVALPAPVVAVPGNHDDRAGFAEHLLGRRGHDPGRPVDQVVDLDGLRLVGLDSSGPGRAWGQLEPDSLQLLAEACAAADRPVAVAFHHPPTDLRIPGLDRIRLRDEHALAAVLAEAPGVLAVLCGHSHTAAAATLAVPGRPGGLPVRVAAGVRSGAWLPAETHDALRVDCVLFDEALPPAVSVHLVGADSLVTHVRCVPAGSPIPPAAPPADAVVRPDQDQNEFRNEEP